MTRKKGKALIELEKQRGHDFLDSDFYTRKRDFGGRKYTDEEVWFLPVNLLIRRDPDDTVNPDDAIKEIIVQHEGMKLSMFRITVVNGKLVITA
jgi:hypothetical protein